MKQILPFIIAILFVFSTGQLFSQASDTINPGHHAPVKHPAPGSTDAVADLAKAAANPIANMISLPFQFNFNFGLGEHDRLQTNLNLQPVLPFRMTKTWNVITRTIIPILQQPNLDSVAGSTYGIGNASFNAFFVPPVLGDGLFTYGFGPTLSFPTASRPELGGDALGIGPTIVFLFMPGHWVAGATAAMWWAYKEPHGAEAMKSFFAQYFITYNIKNGWFVNTTPTITANFNAPEGEQWVVPTGAGFGKVQHFKHSAPMKFMLQYYYNVAPSTNSMKQNITFMIVFMFPKKA